MQLCSLTESCSYLAAALQLHLPQAQARMAQLATAASPAPQHAPIHTPRHSTAIYAQAICGRLCA